MIKPEPLTKEKIWSCEKCSYFSLKKEEKCPMCGSKLIEEEVRFKKLNEIQPSFEELVKQRVEWLLKEIEKEKKLANSGKALLNKEKEEWFVDGMIKGLEIAEKLIKKAFMLRE